MSGIRQENAVLIDSGGCGIHGTVVAVSNKARQVTGVIDVRMCEDDCINGLGIDRGCLPISQSQILGPLKQSTVDQDSLIFRLQEKLRSGDCLSSTEEGQFHSRQGYVRRIPSAFRNFVSLCSSTFAALKICPIR